MFLSFAEFMLQKEDLRSNVQIDLHCKRLQIQSRGKKIIIKIQFKISYIFYKSYLFWFLINNMISVMFHMKTNYIG